MDFMPVPSVNRSIPQSIQEECKRLSVEGLAEFYRKNFQNSERIFDKFLKLLNAAQKEVKRPIHKGTPLFNKGIASIAREDFPNGLYYVLLAYIEDTLSNDFDREDEADRAPAGRFLVDTFIIELRLLRDIKSQSKRIKEQGKWISASDPEIILDDVMRSCGISRNDLLRRCKRQDPRLGSMTLGFPQPRERRVFIGANFDTPAFVAEIQIAVVLSGYVPIITAEVFIPPKDTHDASLLLLRTCGHAIFDITNPAGQLMEIERTRDYGVRVLLLRQKPWGHEAHLSQMIESLGYKVELYGNPTELSQKVHDWLEEYSTTKATT